MTTGAHLVVEARRRSGLTQQEFARKVGIRCSVLNAYELGERQPRTATLLSILRIAGFGLRLAPIIDRERNARVLSEVLDLAESLPWRPRRKLTYPPFRHRVGLRNS